MYKYRYLSTLCHSCGFACQQRLLKNVSWPWLSSLRGWGSLAMAFTGKCIYIHTYIYIHVCVLTINSGMDVSGLSSFPSIGHGNTIIFDTRKTLYLKETPTKFLKTYLKDNGNICFVVV